MIQHSGPGTGVIDVGRVLIDAVLYTVKSARVRATTSGNTQLVAAVSGISIRPLSYTVGPASAAGVVTIQDAAGTPVVLVGPFDLAANGGIVNSVFKQSDQQGTSGEAINVNLSVSLNVTIQLWYCEV